MVSVQPAVMGWSSPRHFRGSSSGTELPCSQMPQLQASAGSPTCSRETNLSTRRGTPCDRLVWGCDGLWPWEGYSAWPWWSMVPGCWGLEKQWGGQAGIPGEQREGNPKSVGRPFQNPQSPLLQAQLWDVASAAEALDPLGSTPALMGTLAQAGWQCLMGVIIVFGSE